MTLAQFFALTGVELRANRANTKGHLPPKHERDWGSARDLKQLERKSNGR